MDQEERTSGNELGKELVGTKIWKGQRVEKTQRESGSKRNKLYLGNIPHCDLRLY